MVLAVAVQSNVRRGPMMKRSVQHLPVCSVRILLPLALTLVAMSSGILPAEQFRVVSFGLLWACYAGLSSGVSSCLGSRWRATAV